MNNRKSYSSRLLTDYFAKDSVSINKQLLIKPLYYRFSDQDESEITAFLGVFQKGFYQQIQALGLEITSCGVSEINATKRLFFGVEENGSNIVETDIVETSHTLFTTSANTSSVKVWAWQPDSGGAYAYMDNITLVKQVTGLPVAVTGVSVSSQTGTLYGSDTEQLSASISPANAANQNVTFASDNTSVANVNASGLVTAISESSANITVTTNGRRLYRSESRAGQVLSFA